MNTSVIQTGKPSRIRRLVHDVKKSDKFFTGLIVFRGVHTRVIKQRGQGNRDWWLFKSL